MNHKLFWDIVVLLYSCALLLVPTIVTIEGYASLEVTKINMNTKPTFVGFDLGYVATLKCYYDVAVPNCTLFSSRSKQQNTHTYIFLPFCF
jgi:hypothetical protein